MGNFLDTQDEKINCRTESVQLPTLIELKQKLLN